MNHANLKEFIAKSGGALARGPIALILVEDLVEVDTTIRHHIMAGFTSVVIFAPAELQLPGDLDAVIHRVDYDMTVEGATQTAVNAVIGAAPGQWIYYCYNAEYLFHPFCETRSVSEMLAFHSEERRDAILGYVVDLYANDLSESPNAVSLDTAHLDKTGYYALARPDPEHRDQPKDRQLNFFGGLRWRFEEHISERSRRIDRIPLFRAKPGLELLSDHTFNDQEYNTFACEWHHNVTVSITSFRTAKALKSNAGSTFEIETFSWHNSIPFNWESQQLLDLGLMEPGQWF